MCLGPPRLSGLPIDSSVPPVAKFVRRSPTGQASTKSTSPDVGAGPSHGRGDIQSGAAQTDPQLATSKSNSIRWTRRKSTLQASAVQAKQPLLSGVLGRLTNSEVGSAFPAASTHMLPMSPRTPRLQDCQVPEPACHIHEASPGTEFTHPSVANGVPAAERFCPEVCGASSTRSKQDFSKDFICDPVTGGC